MSSTADDRLVRAARRVGGLGNPFLGEERQRDVWNEASAFGLQLVLWSALLACTVGIWVVGSPAVPYVLTALGITGWVSVLTIAYAQRLGVCLIHRQWLLAPRMVPYGLLVLALLLGLARASSAALSPSFAAGAGAGALLALLALWRAGRSRHADED